MGIIKAAAHAVGTGLADQWLEALEPDNMGAQTVFTKGVQIRKGKGENGKGSDNMVTEGSIYHVCRSVHAFGRRRKSSGLYGRAWILQSKPGYTAFPDERNVGKSSKRVPGKDPFWQYCPHCRGILYQSSGIQGLQKFGTKNAINYFDSFYNAELFLRAHGTYSIKITDPLKFYAEVVPKKNAGPGNGRY